MFCSKCGAEYKDGALFCPKCGMNLQGRVNVPIGNVENKPVKRDRKWLVAVVVILLVVGGADIMLWQAGMLGENSDELDSSISNEVTRGYDESTTAKDVISSEAERLDTGSKFVGYKKDSDTFTYDVTTDIEQMDLIYGEGGSIFGIEAEQISFQFNIDEKPDLDSIHYTFPKDAYDAIYEIISTKYEKYKRKSEGLEFWNTEHYSIYISENDDNAGVRVEIY